MREFDAAAVEDVFSDGLLNVMEAPEFSQSEKLRRVFAVLQNRDYLGSLLGRLAASRRRAGADRHGERGRLRCRTYRSCWPAYGQRDRAHGRRGRAGSNAHVVPACNRDRPLRERAHERAGGAALQVTGWYLHDRRTSAHARRRAHRRARHIAAGADRRDGRAAPAARSPPSRKPPRTRPAGSAPPPTSRTTSAGPSRTASRCSAWPTRRCCRSCWRSPTTSIAPSSTCRPSWRTSSWVEGIAAIDRKLRLLLDSEGLTPIEAVGQPFDPHEHEAVAQEETTAVPEGTVTAELQRGYRIRDRVLRPAMVAVANAIPATRNQDRRQRREQSRSTANSGGIN